MTMLSATSIVLLDGPRVRSPASMAYLVLMNRPVARVYKITIDERAWYRNTSRCGVSCVLKVCAGDTRSLNCTLHPLVYRMGVVWNVGGD